MDLLKKVQEEIVEPCNTLGPTLLKLRLLASKLGSTRLEDWVRHEAEGYPQDVPLPEYRKVPVRYVGTWFGPLGSAIENAPIPPYILNNLAGEGWTIREMRQSIAAIDDLLLNADGGVLQIDASDLIMLLQGKIYPDYSCNSVIGQVGRASLQEIQNAVRHRILQLTIEIGKVVPSIPSEASDQFAQPESSTAQATTQIVNHTIYGDYTNVNNTGANAQITLSIKKGDTQSMIRALINSGIPQEDAKEFAEIIRSEDPESKTDPFGEQAKEWLANNIGKIFHGAWRVSREAAVRVLEKAASQFHGLS